MSADVANQFATHNTDKKKPIYRINSRLYHLFAYATAGMCRAQRQRLTPINTVVGVSCTVETVSRSSRRANKLQRTKSFATTTVTVCHFPADIITVPIDVAVERRRLSLNAPCETQMQKKNAYPVLAFGPLSWIGQPVNQSIKQQCAQ